MFSQNRGTIQDYNIRDIEDYGLELTVYTDNGHQEYRYTISRDERHPNRDQIKIDIKNALEDAMSGKGEFSISEYEERNYIFIKFPDGTLNQYTGRYNK